MSKCCVCGKETDCTALKSTCSDNILTYCSICLQNGYESYDELVNYGLIFECFSPSMQNRVIVPTLRYLGKSLDEFNEEVERRVGH